MVGGAHAMPRSARPLPPFPSLPMGWGGGGGKGLKGHRNRGHGALSVRTHSARGTCKFAGGSGLTTDERLRLFLSLHAARRRAGDLGLRIFGDMGLRMRRVLLAGLPLTGLLQLSSLTPWMGLPGPPQLAAA